MALGQRAAIEAFAKRAGFALIEEYYDAAVSGADPVDQRPGFFAPSIMLLSSIWAWPGRIVTLRQKTRLLEDSRTRN